MPLSERKRRRPGSRPVHPQEIARKQRVYPTLFHFGHLVLPTFGVLAALGLMTALWLSERTAAWAGVDPGRLWDAGIFAVLAAFVLSRLLLAIAYWKTFRAFPVLLLTVPSLTASGLLLTLIATGGWLWLHRVPLLRSVDAWAPCGALVWAFLALGHFAEGSDPGMPTSQPWGVPVMRGEAMRVQPVALSLALGAMLLAAGACALLKRRPASGSTAGWTLLGAGMLQYLASLFRQPGRLLGPLEVLQWAAVGLILSGCALVLHAMMRSERQ